MSSNILGSSFFTSVKNFFTDNQQTILNGLLVVVTICGESIFRVTTWDCPSHQPTSAYYGICFIVGPAIVLLALGILVNKLTWHLCQGCRCGYRKHSHGRIGSCWSFCALIFKALLAPIAWFFLIFLHGNYYVCIRSSAPCDPASEQNMYFKAESHIISWFILSVAMIIAVTGLIISRCFYRVSFLQGQFMSICQEEEAQMFDNVMREKAKQQAEINVKLFLERNKISQEDWNCVSMVPPHAVNLQESKECGYTPIERWHKEEAIRRSSL